LTRVARVTFLVLLGATFAAFFVAQRLKSAPPQIRVTGLAPLFSPNRDGRQDVNRFSLTLEKAAGDVDVDVVNAGLLRVRRLAQDVKVRPGVPLRLRWNGRTDAGRRAPDGRYRLRVTLVRQGQAVMVPGATVVDTKPPHSIVCVGVRCTSSRTANIVAPGTSPIRVYVKGVSRRFDTRVAVLRTDDGPPHVVARFTGPARTHRLEWDGLVDGAPAPPGIYLFRVRVRDRAGNVAVTPRHLQAGQIPGRPGLTIRGIAAQPPLRPVTAGRTVHVFVDARGKPYRWSVRRVGYPTIRRHGRATTPNLAFPAPRGNSGAYLLTLRAGRRTTTVPFLVQSLQKAKILVVVPTITWLGVDTVDDPPFDGLPNTLTDGGVVHWPRVFGNKSHPPGLPAGFADGVAPLLVFLDRHRVSYDLTSDLDLDESTNPRASDRRAVLLAGPEEWVTRALARRLRGYVQDGGRLAYFGPDTLRRGVTLDVRDSGGAGTLSRPTQATGTDALGARIVKPRTVSPPATLIQLDGDPAYPLLTGVDQNGIPGFTQLEESAKALPANTKLLAGVGQDLTDAEVAEAQQTGKPARELRPALTAEQLGKGTVIRVGLAEWRQKLRDPVVAQVTSNIVDILRGVKPHIRSER
jgi:hypothetical protein